MRLKNRDFETFVENRKLLQRVIERHQTRPLARHSAFSRTFPVNDRKPNLTITYVFTRTSTHLTTVSPSLIAITDKPILLFTYTKPRVASAHRNRLGISAEERGENGVGCSAPKKEIRLRNIRLGRRKKKKKKQRYKEQRKKFNETKVYHTILYSIQLTGRNPSDEEMVSCFFQKQMGPRPAGWYRCDQSRRREIRPRLG